MNLYVSFELCIDFVTILNILTDFYTIAAMCEGFQVVLLFVPHDAERDKHLGHV